MKPAATGPNTSLTASANGALERASWSAGIRPISTVQEEMYTDAAISTPPSVAIATLRPGFSTTALATEALSRPVKAQNSSTSDCGMTRIAGSWRTFHESMNSLPSKYHQPPMATSRIGTRPTTIASDSVWHPSLGPRMLTALITQMKPTVATAPGTGWFSAGTKFAR